MGCCGGKQAVDPGARSDVDADVRSPRLRFQRLDTSPGMLPRTLACHHSTRCPRPVWQWPACKLSKLQSHLFVKVNHLSVGAYCLLQSTGAKSVKKRLSATREHRTEPMRRSAKRRSMTSSGDSGSG
jgi:hypothetical protein